MAIERLFFIPTEDVIHPGTREIILHDGQLYHISAIRSASRETGIDYAKGILCLDLNAAWQVQDEYLKANNIPYRGTSQTWPSGQ